MHLQKAPKSCVPATYFQALLFCNVILWEFVYDGIRWNHQHMFCLHFATSSNEWKLIESWFVNGELKKSLTTCTIGLVWGIIRASSWDLSLYDVIPNLDSVEKIVVWILLVTCLIRVIRITGRKTGHHIICNQMTKKRKETLINGRERAESVADL